METTPIALDAASHEELQEKLRLGHAEFQAASPTQEPRIILITRKNVKVQHPDPIPKPKPKPSLTLSPTLTPTLSLSLSLSLSL